MGGTSDGSRGQIFSAEDGEVVAEFYHFGEDADYEFAVQVRFDAVGQAQLAGLLGLESAPEPEALAALLKARFVTYYAVRDFADKNGVPYTHQRDFQP